MQSTKLLSLSKQVRAHTENAQHTGEWQQRVQAAITLQTGLCMHTEMLVSGSVEYKLPSLS